MRSQRPKVTVDWLSNQSFYWPDQTVSYKTRITDKEDQLKGGINPRRAVVTFEHIPFGEDITLAAQNYESAVGTSMVSAGEKLISQSDCKVCHGLDKKSIGPAYMEIAKRYQGDSKAVEKLAAKVVSGGNGNWGENAMSAHPQLTLAQTLEMVTYILSLARPDTKIKSLPLSGSVRTQSDKTDKEAGKYLLTVSYADKGANAHVKGTGWYLQVSPFYSSF